MKIKPNTDQFKLKKDPSEFLEGGAADLANQPENLQQISAKTQVQQTTLASNTKLHREQKVFRLPLDLINTLKRESYERSMETGSRVTETELVEKALRLFFNR